MRRPPVIKSEELTLGSVIAERIAALAAISESPHELTRLFLSPEHRKAASLIESWMREAGMTASMDAIGNVVGRYEGHKAGLPALLLGSHFDTVRNAGRWDGALGLITAICCVDILSRQSRRLPFAIEVIGFADEEGVRFSSTLIGSRAVAGDFDEKLLTVEGADGKTLNAALRDFGLDPAAVRTAARTPSDFLAYIELHIEQGPVLEAAHRPVGLVTAISGAARMSVQLDGVAGHAGTVPSSLRRDALAGAAECILAIEATCRTESDCVATVGTLDVAPGATNVIPGRTRFTIDVRCARDEQRRQVVSALIKQIEQIAKARGLVSQVAVTHENRTVPCADWLQEQIAASISRQGYPPLALPSGAGHDAMAIAGIADIGMVFVRCRGGISHHPEEHVAIGDADAGARVLLDFIENFSAKGAPGSAP